MAKYLFLYNSPVSAEKQMSSATPEQAKAGMDAWMMWAGKAGDSVVDLGQPLGQGRHLEGGGSASPSSSQARGYSIIEAESLDAAAKMVEDHPHFMTPGGSSIEVFELLEMPGM